MAGRGRKAPVVVRSMNQPKPGWDLEQALSLLEQGYDVEHVARQSGFAAPFLAAQLRKRSDHRP